MNSADSFSGSVLALLALVVCGCNGGGAGPALGDPNLPKAPPPSSDAALLSLSLAPGKLDTLFEPTVFQYTSSVGFAASRVDIAAAASDADATVVINGQPAATGNETGSIALAEGPNTITVNVTAEDGVTVNSYSVTVTRQSVSDFAQRAYVKASNTDVDDLFGAAIALDGNTLAVGAYGEDSAAAGINGDETDNSATDAGAVYVFERDAAGTWFQQAYLKASNPDTRDEFGRALALAGDTLVVGTYAEDSAATGIDGDQLDNSAAQSGAVYVFVRDTAGAWTQQAYVKASNADAGDWFGAFSLALSGDTLAVPAIKEDTVARDSGAVYVYQRDQDGIWSEQAMLKASNAGDRDNFGTAVALQGDTLVIGADQHDSGTGAAYVFTRDGTGVWSEQAILTASNAEPGDLFGASVAISGDTIAIAAQEEDSASTGVGGDGLDNSATLSGAVYVFVRDAGNAWTEQAYVKASNTEAQDYFSELALSGDTLVVSAKLEDGAASGINGDSLDNSSSSAGAAYLFARDATGNWTQHAYIKASNPDTKDQFSGPILSGDTVILRSYGEDSDATGIDGDQTSNAARWAGAVYVFQ